MKHFQCDMAKPVKTPMDPSKKFLSNKGKPESQLEFSQGIRCLDMVQFLEYHGS